MKTRRIIYVVIDVEFSKEYQVETKTTALAIARHLEESSKKVIVYREIYNEIDDIIDSEIIYYTSK